MNIFISDMACWLNVKLLCGVQIWPVLCAGSAYDPDQNTHSLHLSATSKPYTPDVRPASGRAAGQMEPALAKETKLDVNVQQLTVWLSFPLLQRLQHFFQPLLRHQAQQAVLALRPVP